jgi:hypothetical protein
MWSFISLIYLPKERVGRRKECKPPLETARRCRIYTSAVRNGWWMFRKSRRSSLFCLFCIIARSAVAVVTSAILLNEHVIAAFFVLRVFHHFASSNSPAFLSHNSFKAPAALMHSSEQ